MGVDRWDTDPDSSEGWLLTGLRHQSFTWHGNFQNETRDSIKTVRTDSWVELRSKKTSMWTSANGLRAAQWNLSFQTLNLRCSVLPSRYCTEALWSKGKLQGISMTHLGVGWGERIQVSMIHLRRGWGRENSLLYNPPWWGRGRRTLVSMILLGEGWESRENSGLYESLWRETRWQGTDGERIRKALLLTSIEMSPFSQFDTILLTARPVICS